MPMCKVVSTATLQNCQKTFLTNVAYVFENFLCELALVHVKHCEGKCSIWFLVVYNDLGREIICTKYPKKSINNGLHVYSLAPRLQHSIM